MLANGTQVYPDADRSVLVPAGMAQSLLATGFTFSQG